MIKEINVNVGTLTVIFVVLKLTNVIEWSWLWIFSPLWIVLGISIITNIIDTLF